MTVAAPPPTSDLTARARAAGAANTRFRNILKRPHISRVRALTSWLSECAQKPPVLIEQLIKDLDVSHVFLVKILEPAVALSLVEAEFVSARSIRMPSGYKIRDHPSRLDASDGQRLTNRGKRMTQPLVPESELDIAVMSAVAPLLK